jgi:hypothetical protein
MSDDIGAMSDHAGPHPPPGDRSQELLGAAPADGEQRLEGGPVHPGLGGIFELADGFGQAVEPERLIRH